MAARAHGTTAPTTAPIAVDLFCGAGGFATGLVRAGFTIVCAVDSWDRAVESYRLNFSHPCLKADVAELTGRQIRAAAQIGKRDIDLVVGGPPCQGFSIQRIGPDRDSRNNLVAEYARLLEELGPCMFVLENVPGLVGKRGRPLFEAFINRMAAAGYETEAQVINAAEYGVPQVRKRVIVVGWRKKDISPFVLPASTHRPEGMHTVWDAIGNLPAPAEVGESGDDPLHRKTRLSALNQERLKHIPPGGGMEHLPIHLRVDCHKGGADRIGHRYVYGRLAADRPAATITARFDSFTRGRFAHPFDDRNITLREGARLQTFSDAFRFVGSQEDIAAQIGNAVPPSLAEILGLAIHRHLARTAVVPTRTAGAPRRRPGTAAQRGLFGRGEPQG